LLHASNIASVAALALADVHVPGVAQPPVPPSYALPAALAVAASLLIASQQTK
jgi:hypothetical protein